jgi:hypothetical protein
MSEENLYLTDAREGWVAIQTVKRVTEKMREYDEHGSTTVNVRQVLGLLSPTWPDGNYEAAASEEGEVMVLVGARNAEQHNEENLATHHDDQTMVKVYDALRDSDLTDKQAMDAINSMQSVGIFFRERAK